MLSSRTVASRTAPPSSLPRSLPRYSAGNSGAPKVASTRYTSACSSLICPAARFSSISDSLLRMPEAATGMMPIRVRLVDAVPASVAAICTAPGASAVSVVLAEVVPAA